MQKKTQGSPNVVVIGAGFGGVKAAKDLQKIGANVTIIDKYNHHVFQPLLYQVATAELSVEDIAHPTRDIFKNDKNVDFRLAEVTGIDFNRKTVTLDTGTIGYEYLIIAAGAQSNYFGMESVAKNSFPLKTIDESVSLRNHILSRFEMAAIEDDTAKRKALLNFVIVGGGPTGVETAGGISELVRFVLSKEYHHLDFSEVQITLVEAGEKLFAPMHESLRAATVKYLTKMGVQVRVLVQVTDYDGERLTLKGGEVIETTTVVWGAGVRAVELLDKLGIEQASMRRAVVNDYLQLPHNQEVFVIGDATHFMNGERPLPMIAPVATQMAAIAVQNINNMQKGKELKKFVYADVGSMAIIGRNYAVMTMPNNGMTTHGFIAWMGWLVVHVMRLVGFRNQATVTVKWIWDYFSKERVAALITRTHQHSVSRDK